jgi:hypothetical protein
LPRQTAAILTSEAEQLFFKEDNQPLPILSRLQNTCEDRTTKQTQVYFWIGEVPRDYESLADEERRGTPFSVSFDEGRAHRTEMDPHTIGRKLAHSLEISPQTVIKQLQNGPGTIYFHLRPVPRLGTEAETINGTWYAYHMIGVLDNDAWTGSNI